MSEIIQELFDSHIRIHVLSIDQKGKRFFVGKVSTKFFLDVYTVEPAEYDMYKQSVLAAQFKDEGEYYNYLVSTDKDAIDTKAFQRKEDKKRVKEIVDFLSVEEYALFPNSIIVTCDLINDFLPEEVNSIRDFYDSITKNTDLKNYSYLEESNGDYFLYLPKIKNSILVIDGQHRIRGLEDSDVIIQNSYDILLSFIIGYDRSTIAKLFYTINYTQKSVNKSQLYHLTGEFSRQLTEIAFMHEVVRILNEIESSPFFHRIKMLGYIPDNTSESDKKYLTISQAFLIDYLVPTIVKGKSDRTIYQPVFLFYYTDQTLQIEIIKFIIKYFSAIKKLFKEDWENPENSIITKTLSIGAFLRVMHFLFVIFMVDHFNFNPKKIKDLTVEDIIGKLSGVEKINFSKKGEFGGVASAGSLNKLKEIIVSNSLFAEGKSYAQFIEQFQLNQLPKYRSWLMKNV